MMAISGGLDLRTPTVGAQAVVSQFPQGHLVVVPSVGHDPVDADFSACASNAVHTWITTGTAPPSCTAKPALVAPVAPIPSPSKHVLTARATYAAAKSAVSDAQALWLMNVLSGALDAGSRRVRRANGRRRAEPQAREHGHARRDGGEDADLQKFGPPVVFQGAVTVGGAIAQHGLLGLNGASLRGTLGGRSVG
jgi:hypothetical protein